METPAAGSWKVGIKEASECVASSGPEMSKTFITPEMPADLGLVRFVWFEGVRGAQSLEGLGWGSLGEQQQEEEEEEEDGGACLWSDQNLVIEETAQGQAELLLLYPSPPLHLRGRVCSVSPVFHPTAFPPALLALIKSTSTPCSSITHVAWQRVSGSLGQSVISLGDVKEQHRSVRDEQQVGSLRQVSLQTQRGHSAVRVVTDQTQHRHVYTFKISHIHQSIPIHPPLKVKED